LNRIVAMPAQDHVRKSSPRLAHGHAAAFRGRGANVNMPGRYEREWRIPADDGWASDAPCGAGEDERTPTHVIAERARSIITRNDSPDILFDRSINPYRGCEHGCSYCFARPTHAYLGLSPGLDFETRIFAKTNAADLLARELSAPSYQPATIVIGANTDPYQPVERSRRLMRAILEVLAQAQHPVAIVTKSALVLRDLDLLAAMAEKGLAKVALSITTLDGHLARRMEPRAAQPQLRLEAIRALSEAGVPVSVMVAPIVPGLTDHEVESILQRARAAGATEAGYIMLRLPHETKDIFRIWLETHYPDKVERIVSLVSGVRGGKAYDARFGLRMTGTGPYAWMIGRRFEMAAARLGFNRERLKLRCDLFQRPARRGEQLSLFATSVHAGRTGSQG